ncbi:MAG: hypothetical protein QOC92_2725, partial [Acidimicrobiaceae bacterium]
LAGEWSRHAYEQGAIVLYGRCDEDLGAPYQPFAEALRSLIPSLGASRLRGLRGAEALLSLVPGLTDVLPDLAAPTRADPDTERYALFDAVVAVLGVASTSAPVVLILDDLHWAAKPTLLLLRHLLRFGEHARVQIVGTYRSTDLDRSHPLAAMLADLHRDGSATRLQLSGLDEVDVSAYVAEAGYDDEELARALASVTGGNPFFLIEALRHVDESGGRWDPSTLPQGVREAVSRRLSRLPAETNKALAAAAVVGSRFALDLVERVVGDDLVDAFDEACKAGIVIEEPGGRYRFNHAIVRQSLLAELASVRRMRLHQSIATTLESEPGADDELLADLAHHYFECAWAGNAAKAVDYCRRAADQAMSRLAYEGAADLYDRAVHALEEVDEELPDRDDQQAELLIARCEALLAAGDVVTAAGAVSQLQAATRDSARLAAWGTCFDGQLSMLTDPERLDEIESALAAAAEKLAGLDDAAGEAKAHTVRAGCLARLGRIADAETALDHALTAARRAQEHRRVNAVLANAPLAALWGPNPVPRAGGRCLDVVRLLRITTGSPVVEATSTRCQAVLDALRGRAAAGRSLLDSARRTLTELGMRHALIEVDQFAGILELVADDPAAAEPHLRRAYNGFRRMGLDADTAETAALLARACLSLDRDADADELCTESERLAGHALKASIVWRTVRAQLLARGGAHEEARRVAEDAVAVAERTDLLVDHGDACLALATVLDIAGDSAGARAAAEQAVGLYELKGAAALAEKARSILGAEVPVSPPPPEGPPTVELDNACVRAIRHLEAAVDREAWDEVERLVATDMSVEGRRKVIGFPRVEMSPSEWAREIRHLREAGAIRHQNVVLAVRGERLALTRSELGTEDESPGAPQVELLRLFGLDEGGRIAILVALDIDDIEAAIAELDAAHARLEEPQPRPSLENAASGAENRLNGLFAESRWDEIEAVVADDVRVEERRQVTRRESNGRATFMAEIHVIADLGVKNMTSEVLAIRGESLVLSRVRFAGRDRRPDAFHTELLRTEEMNADGRLVATLTFDLDDIDAAIAELDSRYLAGEAAAHANTWSVITAGHSAINRRELPPITADCVNIDHRRGAAFAPGEMTAYLRAGWDLDQNVRTYIEVVHRLTDFGAVYTHAGHGVSHAGFDAEWRGVDLVTVDGDMVNRCEIFDEADLDAALARFERLGRPAPRLENAASQVFDRFLAHYQARDWDAMAEMIRGDFSIDDRRRTVNGGVRHGRDAEIEDLRAAADVGFTNFASTIIATRGGRLFLTLLRASSRDPEAIQADALQVVEINADDRMAAVVVFDPEDIDAAFAELDAWYLSGEAAPHARIWQLAVDTLDELNRHQPGPLIRGFTYTDHRRVPFAQGDFGRAIEDLWVLVPDASYRVTAVHALEGHGGVVSLVIDGTDTHGNEMQWARALVMSVTRGEIRQDIYEEDDLDAAIARFEELRPHAPRLENAASRVYERLWMYFAARDWAAIADNTARDISDEDRRRVVNAGVRHGRDAVIANLRAIAEVGTESVTSSVVATRGERLALNRVRFSVRRGEVSAEVLNITEIDANDRITASVQLDPDDLDAAFEELDARYLAGEAAAHADTWSVITGALAAVNRHELPELTPDWVNIDHRRAIAFAPGDMTAYVHATWEHGPDGRAYIEAVHRLSNLGAIVTQVGHEISPQGFEAAWRMLNLLTVEGDLFNRCELYDEEDIDAALARFDELSRPVPQLENAASRVYERFLTYFAARDWAATPEILADDISTDDRRRVVNAGLRQGRDAAIAEILAIAEVGVTNVTSTVIATRGGRLVLSRVGLSVGAEAFYDEVLNIVEIDADDRIARRVVFDLDDIDAAFEELDARYLAGEAAAHLHTWSVIARAYAAVNRHELPEVTADCVNLDHRRIPTLESGEMNANLRAGWDLTPDYIIHVEAVHRLSDLGAVVTHTAHGVSQAGFNAEWRMIQLLTVDGDLVNRGEVFDETDLDAALARFDQLSRPTPQLENAASRADKRVVTLFETRDWDAIAETMATDVSMDDRRRVVNAGTRQGRGLEIANLSALAEVGVTKIASTVIATRGQRLALVRSHVSDRWSVSGESAALCIVEVNADHRIGARTVFDVDDIDAAFEELDARYLAGEAADHSHAWLVIAAAYVALNRHQLPATTPDWVNIDHRRGRAFAPGDMIPYVRATWDVTPDLSYHVEAVHKLSNLGAVVTRATKGTSQEGFYAEWREIALLTFEGDLISRCEMFDEEDIDAALARFDELDRPAPQLENAACRAFERFETYFAARDWTAMAEILAEDMCNDDRRRVVGAGVLHGRDIDVAHMRAIADVGANTITSTVIATRGERLVLRRLLFSGEDQGPEAFEAELLGIVEIDSDERIAARLSFDADDLDAAFEELDARYLAGEAAAHARMWSLITQTYAAFNRHGLVPDWVSIDHRRGSPFASSDLNATIRASRDLTPDLTIQIETVHRLSAFGAVVTNMSFGTSDEGFAAEWRMVQLLTVDGDRINRLEIFDETDLHAALARFDELNRPAPELDNAASRLLSRFLARFAARNWNAMAELLTDDTSTDDRRPLVGVGPRCGRDTVIADWRATADVGVKNVTFAVVATRGERLALARLRFMGRDERPEAFRTDVLGVIEIDTDQRIPACVMLDVDDVDAAFAELDARYLAGEAAAHAHTWSVIAYGYAALNRHEIPATTPDWVNIDHRRVTSFEAGDLTASFRAAWDVVPDITTHIVAVHRLSGLGTVVTHVAYGTSHEGFAAEWQRVVLGTVDGDLINRVEIFDEANLDAALARFDELSRPAPRLENAASQVDERFRACFAARDWDAMGDMLADHMCNDDRRRVVNAGLRRGRDIEIANTRAFAELGVTNVTSDVIATRGDRLALGRNRFMGRDQRPEAFRSELLCIVEIDADERITARVSFDVDNMDDAFEELDARYLAGEAAAHAHTWSVIAQSHAAFNRRELPAKAPDFVDHRPLVTLEAGDPTAMIRDIWDFTPDLRAHIEAVHRLSDLGAVFTLASRGTSQAGFDAEWRVVDILTVDGDLVNRIEMFDEADIGAAIARFDELSRLTPRLENAATRTWARVADAFNRRDLDGCIALTSTDGRLEDRRKGLRALHDGPARRKAVRAIFEAPPSSWRMEVEPIAIRGSRLSLTRERYRDTDDADRPIVVEVFTVMEVSDGDLVHDTVDFDPDDIDAAFEELDARYLAGEAAAHAQTWSAVAQAYAGLNRHQFAATTPDWVNVDRRRLATIDAGHLSGYIRASRNATPDARIHIEAVHRLSSLGAVVSRAVNGSSQDGFYAEWREIDLLTFDGALINRCEIFDQADLDAALARFRELDRPAPQLENAASRMDERLKASFAARDWAATQEILAEDTSNDDRRRVVGAGLLHGRELNIADLQAIADVGTTVVTSTVIATRQERLALSRYRFSGRDPRPEAFHADMLGVVEINADNRIAARVWFDLDDFDAAFDELDARYLSDEATAHAHTWSIVMGGYAAFNHHELPAFAPDWENIDHRRAIAFAPGDHGAYIHATWDLGPHFRAYAEVVHRLSSLGAVVTHAVRGTTHEGFEAEWREIALVTVEGDLVNRVELFDQSDIDAALARFDELTAATPQLENAAIRARARGADAYNRRDVEGFLALAAGRYEDRRKGLRDEGAADRNFANAVLSETPTSWRLEIEPVAIRGDRLALSRETFRDVDEVKQPITVELIVLTEVADTELDSYTVFFDPDDVDAAFAELDARYLAGEAAAHTHTWSVISWAYEAVNRGELPTTTPDWVNIDHQLRATIEAGDLTAYLRAGWDLTPELKIRVAAVHRLSDLGVVVTHAAHGISKEGFDAEWRMIALITADGDRINRLELFDEADLDAALARFRELSRPARLLENAATRVHARMMDAFNRRDLDSFLAVVTADGRYEDRRKGLRDEGPIKPDFARALFVEAAPNWQEETEAVAIRGRRLVLYRLMF